MEGVSAIREQDLVAAMRSAVGADYSRNYVIHASAGTLTDMYRQRGYWRAAFTPPTAVPAATGCAGADVTLHVTEGDAYAWDHADWSGASALPVPKLNALLGMKGGDVADGTKIEDGLRGITKAYGSLGYITEDATFVPHLDDATRHATFEIEITEGAQFHMGTLEFVGLSEQAANGLRKNWRLKQGDVYDESYVSKFQAEETMYTKSGSAERHFAQLDPRINADAHVVDVRFVFE